MSEFLRTPDSRFENLPEYPFTPHYIELGNLRMHYVDEGAGDRGELLLLHGQGAWSYIYRKMIPLLADAGFRVLAPDLIGFGRSDKPVAADAYSHAAHIAWLDAFLDRVGVPGMHAFCHDWGAFFAMRIAAESPARLGRLIFSSCQAPLPNPNGSQWFNAWRRRMFAAPTFPISQMVQEGVQRTLSAAELAGYDAPFPDESFKVAPKMFPFIHPVVLSGDELADYQAAWAKLAHWQQPVLTLFCDRDARQAEALKTHIPGAAGQPHRVFPNCSFYLQEDQSGALADATIDFLGKK
jgi:haloalkane dehalogenase